MKIIVFLISLSACIQVFAQDSWPQYKTVLVTNWVKPGPYLRIVDGKTYNIAYSQLWGEPIGGRTQDDDTGHFIRYETIPQQIKGEKVFCEMYAVEWWYDYFGHPKDEDKWQVKTIVIYNAPTNLILGRPFKFTCMKVGDLIEGNRFICEAYNCGIQDTNLVPVIKSIRVRAN